MPEPIVPVTTTVWGLEYSVHGAFIVYDPPKRRDIVHTIGTTRGLLAFFHRGASNAPRRGAGRGRAVGHALFSRDV